MEDIRLIVGERKAWNYRAVILEAGVRKCFSANIRLKFAAGQRLLIYLSGEKWKNGLFPACADPWMDSSGNMLFRMGIPLLQSA